MVSPCACVDARTVTTRARVGGLSADGSHVALVVKSTSVDCEHVAVWKPGDISMQRFASPAPCATASRLRDVELAGSRVAWVPLYGAPRKPDCDIALKFATLADPVPRTLHQPGLGAWGACKAGDPYHLHGDGDLLVFADRGFTGPDARLVRVGGGSERCQTSFDTPSICATLRRRASAVAPESVSGGLIAAREGSVVAVLDERGALVREFRFPPSGVSGARLDGARLVVWRLGAIELYDVASGAHELSRPLPAGYRLDVDGGVAVLLRGDSVMLLDARDGRSRTVAPGSGPVFADLEPPGLYYSHPVGQAGRVVFVPRSELF